jgi:uncharacterized membrane protein
MKDKMSLYLLPGLLFCLALTVRSYRLTVNPLWLDEIYGYQLGERGVLTILKNSFYDPHPPLYYLLQWVLSGFGTIRTEWAWRWLPVLSGALTVPLVYLVAVAVAGRYGALLSGLVLAFSPTHVYFSQEARGFAFVTFLAALTSWLMLRIQREPRSVSAWTGYTIATIVGLYSSYNYLLVAGIQAALMVYSFRRERITGICLGIIAFMLLPLLPFMLTTMQHTVSVHLASMGLSFTRVSQALLAGEPLRYGFAWPHYWLPILVGILLLMGIWHAFQQRPFSLIIAYNIVLLLLPLTLFFGVINLVFKINLPLSESKQFMVILPALFVLLALGLFFLRISFPPLGSVTALVMAGGMVYASFASLQSYWHTTKSPEGLAAITVRDRLLDGDAVVSLHYSLDAAASFYLAGIDIFYKPRQSQEGYLFSQSASVLPPPLQEADEHLIPLAAVRSHSRVWVLSQNNSVGSMKDAMIQGCQLVNQWSFSPFQVSLYAGCP